MAAERPAPASPRGDSAVKRSPRPRRAGAGKVPVAITIGDPSGIGPEVALKAILTPEVRRKVKPILVGDQACWARAANRLGLTLGDHPATLTKPMRMSAAACGEVAYSAIIEAVQIVRSGAAAAVVTAPISKA